MNDLREFSLQGIILGLAKANDIVLTHGSSDEMGADLLQQLMNREEEKMIDEGLIS